MKDVHATGSEILEAKFQLTDIISSAELEFQFWRWRLYR
jgi:hypothetical protein